MFPPFPTQKAAKICAIVIEKINSGEIKIERVTQISEERRENGFMVGALVCTDKNGDEKNLITISGISRRLVLPASLPFIFVPPIVSAAQIADALSENDAEIHALTQKINAEIERSRNVVIEPRRNVNDLIERRKILCATSLSRVHALYNFHFANGEKKSLFEILKTPAKLPPTGTGDCCAPKLFDFAFKNALLPVSLCENVFPSGEEKNPCDERCAILLPKMLGLKIIFRDDDICVIDKPSGLLSVPGRGEEKHDSAQTRLRRLFPQIPEKCAIHRLDMETSGIMILAMNLESLKKMQRQFENGEVKKEYVALLDGVLSKMGIAKTGEMETFFRVDLENRPHQIWDSVHGKKAITRWEILGVQNYHAPNGEIRPATRVRFLPQTGRTHQLRTASADLHGFGVPIIGDSLYGKKDAGERLMLHAQKIEFLHPRTNQKIVFECTADF